MRRQERLRRTPPFIPQHGQELPFRVELGGIAEFGHGFAGHPMNPHAGPLRPFGVARLRELPQQRDHAKLFEQHRIEGDLVQAVEDVTRRRG
jgi:hypothetical protein